MMRNFQEYLTTRKALLDEAFTGHLAGLLAGLSLQDRAFLTAALAGGKKLRGCLACLVSDALGGHLPATIPRAVAVELIQAATLIHDDFVDQDRMRRNQAAVWTLEGARRAVLIGDVIFSSALKMMSELGRQDGLVASQTIAEVAQGALHEPLNPLSLVQEILSGRLKAELYEKIIYLKTGVLFGAACRLGAIAAGADPGLIETSYRYGLRIGEAYQLADDLQEIQHHRETLSIGPERMAALAPAFLRFHGEMAPQIIAVLQGEVTELDEAAQACFGAVAKRMEQEIAGRLLSACAEMEENFPANGFRQLVCEAPRDIIRMMNG